MIFRDTNVLSEMHHPKGTVLEDNYAGLTDAFGDRILPVLDSIAERWAELRTCHRDRGRVLIAATALVRDLTRWTRETRDFEGAGVRLFNPWEA